MNRSDLLALRSQPNVAAFLRLIRQGESSQGPEAYTELYGGGQFDDLSRHPNTRVTAGGYTSTAAGAYQFLYRTWLEIAQQYGFSDFTPENQDCAAIALIARRKALDAVIAGRVREAINLCRLEWASLPGSTYGQPTQKLQNAIAVYLQYGGTLATETPSVSAPPRKDKVMLPIILPILQSLIPLIPQLGSMFAQGEVAQRNVAAADAVGKAVTEAVGAVNLQEAAEKIANDSAARDAAQKAVAIAIAELQEVGGGGIAQARKDAANADQLPPWKNSAIWISLIFVPLIYAAAYAVLYTDRFSDDLKTMVVTAIFAGLLGSITGFFLGSSLSSRNKDAALTGRPS